MSLTSHREELINRVINVTREVLGISANFNARPEVPDSEEKRRLAITTFRDTFAKIAREMGVNPDNLAFNIRD